MNHCIDVVTLCIQLVCSEPIALKDAYFTQACVELYTLDCGRDDYSHEDCAEFNTCLDVNTAPDC